MKSKVLIATLFVASTLIPLALNASPQGSGKTEAVKTAAKQDVVTKQRSELTYHIVKKWGAHVQEAYRASPKKWAMDMVPLFRASSMDAMHRAANARTFDDMNDVLLQNDSRSGKKISTSKALGDIDKDLVFVPITPCRIFDTRLAGGAIAAAGVRNFDVTAVTSYAAQGGEASNCSGAGAAGEFAAAVINFTVVNPTSQGFVTAYPLLTTRPLAATMVHAPGALLSNTSIVRLDQGGSTEEMSVYSSGGTHLVGDMVGYFIRPQATAVNCITVASGTSNDLPAGVYTSISVPSCPVGYEATSLSFFASSDVLQADSDPAAPVLYVKNVGAVTANGVRGKTRCCRVPGR